MAARAPAAPAALLLAVVCAACVGPSVPPAGDPPGPAPGTLLLSQCTGFEAAAPMAPTASSPAQPPPGWGRQEPVSSLGVLGMACRRVAFGAFERGPVHLVAEVHDNFLAPAACDAGGETSDSHVVASLLVDDADLAHALATAQGMPARAGAVSATALDGPAGGTRSAWAWGEPGRPASSLWFVDDGEAASFGRPLRLFWPQGEGIGRLDLDMRGFATSTSRPAAGEVHGALLDGPFLGTARPHRDHAATGTFAAFADAACTGAAG